jgi:hypothetical protein
MIDLKYTITKFDNQTKTVTVTFEDGSWAEIRLSNPLPKNIDELEAIIRQYAAPVEAIEAQTMPDFDISYIEQLVGNERTTTRFQLNPPQEDTEPSSGLDPAVEENMKMWEEITFQKKVGEALVKLGVVTENPATIPVASI